MDVLQKGQVISESPVSMIDDIFQKFKYVSSATLPENSNALDYSSILCIFSSCADFKSCSVTFSSRVLHKKPVRSF